jgi:hypothetical protein
MLGAGGLATSRSRSAINRSTRSSCALDRRCASKSVALPPSTLRCAFIAFDHRSGVAVGCAITPRLRVSKTNSRIRPPIGVMPIESTNQRTNDLPRLRANAPTRTGNRRKIRGITAQAPHARAWLSSRDWGTVKSLLKIVAAAEGLGACRKRPYPQRRLSKLRAIWNNHERRSLIGSGKEAET